MKSLKLLLLAVSLAFLGTVPSRAEKFSSSLHQDIGSSVSDQAIANVPQLPSQASGAKMPSLSTTSFPDTPAAPVPPADLQTTETTMPAPVIPVAASQSPNFNNPTAPALKNPFEFQGPKISRPDFEAKFKKLIEQQNAEKTKKKKKLSEAILDEIKNYGLFLLFGLAAILLVYALRKDISSSKTQSAPPKHPLDKPRDIWKEDF